MPASVPEVDGNNVLYRLLSDLLESDDDRSDSLIATIIRSYAVWFPPAIYVEVPVLLPWIVRDASCRPRVVGGVKTPDEWSAPNANGYQRDDNTMIKNLKSGLVVSGPPNGHLNGKKLGKGFVAAHVWREVRLEDLASGDPRLNSFVPNLVWLPAQVAKLSDQEGGPLQEALKAVAIQIFRSTPVVPALRGPIDEIWELLPDAKSRVQVDVSDLNWFDASDVFVSKRRAAMDRTIELCRAIIDGRPLPPKGRISTRYYQGLPALGPTAATTVLDSLTALRSA